MRSENPTSWALTDRPNAALGMSFQNINTQCFPNTEVLSLVLICAEKHTHAKTHV